MENKKISTLITESKDHSVHGTEIYKKLGQVFLWQELDENGQEEAMNEANILVIGLSLMIDKHLIDKMPNLKVIATQTTGLNHIDVKYAEEKGIKIISLRGYTDFLQTITSTAEHAWGMTLSLLRNIPWAFEHVKNNGWDRLLWRGHELKGKTLGIVGLGRLGKMLAKYGNAFGMDVISTDPKLSEEEMKKFGAKKVDLDTLIKTSDIVTLHVLLNDDVYNLIKETHLKSMKPTAYFINTARAELVEKDALYNALKNKWIAGAAIDVLWDEKPDGSHLKNDPLWEYAKINSNLIISPHIGGAAFEAMYATQEFIAGLVVKNFA